MELVTIRLPDGTTIKLTPYNARVFIHPAEFKHLDHVFVVRPVNDEEGEGFYIFENRQLIRYMMDCGWYSYTWLPIPDDDDRAAYDRYKRNHPGDEITEDEINAFIQLLEGLEDDER